MEKSLILLYFQFFIGYIGSQLKSNYSLIANTMTFYYMKQGNRIVFISLSDVLYMSRDMIVPKAT